MIFEYIIKIICILVAISFSFIFLRYIYYETELIIKKIKEDK